MVISERDYRSDPGCLVEIRRGTMEQCTRIYHVGSDKDPLVIGKVLMSG